jgi:hypothetical protein
VFLNVLMCSSSIQDRDNELVFLTSSRQLGPENGMAGAGRKRAQGEPPASAV